MHAPVRHRGIGLIISLMLLVAIHGPSSTHAAEGIEQALKARVAKIQSGESPRIDGAIISAVSFIPRFYKQREFQPAWTDQGNVKALLEAVDSSEEHGLLPSDFHAAALRGAQSRIAEEKSNDAAAQADFELLMTDSLVRLGTQLFDGKVNPVALDTTWNFPSRVLDQDPVTLVSQAIEGGTLAALLRELAPQHPVYEEFKTVLARYRTIAADGGWPQLPDGPSLKPGETDARVAVLRDRLRATGDLPQTSAGSGNVYDQTLEEAVKRFQNRHGLEVDGVVGPGTRDAMNVPVQARIDQIRVNLERTRWVLPGLRDRFVIVNIAGFRTYLMEERDKEVWSTRSIVGKPFHKSPVFADSIRFLVINPTWTVPAGILERSILPKARKDPGYLTRNNFGVVAGDGKRIDPSTVNWGQLSAKGFPYRIVQAPGPNNALGQIKFMFPNEHAVYLHDTPDKSLFEESERAFSSGCIRIDNPFELAELLLADEPTWNRERMDQVVASGKTETVNLASPIPVLLLYWTVELNKEDDTVRFMADVYERDGRILQGLQKEYQLVE